MAICETIAEQLISLCIWGLCWVWSWAITGWHSLLIGGDLFGRMLDFAVWKRSCSPSNLWWKTFLYLQTGIKTYYAKYLDTCLPLSLCIKLTILLKFLLKSQSDEVCAKWCVQRMSSPWHGCLLRVQWLFVCGFQTQSRRGWWTSRSPQVQSGRREVYS